MALASKRALLDDLRAALDCSLDQTPIETGKSSHGMLDLQTSTRTCRRFRHRLVGSLRAIHLHMALHFPIKLQDHSTLAAGCYSRNPTPHPPGLPA